MDNNHQKYEKIAIVWNVGISEDDEKYIKEWTGMRYADLVRLAQDREQWLNHDSPPSWRRRYLMMMMKLKKCYHYIDSAMEYEEYIWSKVKARTLKLSIAIFNIN